MLSKANNCGEIRWKAWSWYWCWSLCC